MTRALLTAFDRAFPEHGPCGICGGPDARHRMTDAIAGRARAGDNVLDLAADYGMPVPDVRAAIVRDAVERTRSRFRRQRGWRIQRLYYPARLWRAA